MRRLGSPDRGEAERRNRPEAAPVIVVDKSDSPLLFVGFDGIVIAMLAWAWAFCFLNKSFGLLLLLLNWLGGGAEQGGDDRLEDSSATHLEVVVVVSSKVL